MEVFGCAAAIGEPGILEDDGLVRTGHVIEATQ